MLDVGHKKEGKDETHSLIYTGCISAAFGLFRTRCRRVLATDTSHTKIVEKSPPYGIPPVVMHPHVDRNLKRRLQEVFLSLDEHEKGSALLDQLKIDRFEQGNDAMYDSVRHMQRWLAESTERHE